jgi:hypothetical protein
MQLGYLSINVLVCTRAGSSHSNRPTALAARSRWHYKEIGGCMPPMWPARLRDIVELTNLRRPSNALRGGTIPPPINHPTPFHQTMAHLTEEQSKLYARDPPQGEFFLLMLIPSLSRMSCQQIVRYGTVCDGYKMGGQLVLVGCMLST